MIEQMYEKTTDVVCKKSVIYDETLKKVSEITEIPAYEILAKGTKGIDIVDARHLLVYALSKKGFYSSTIARLTGISHSAVNRIIAAWGDRCGSNPILKQYLRYICS